VKRAINIWCFRTSGVAWHAGGKLHNQPVKELCTVSIWCYKSSSCRWC